MEVKFDAYIGSDFNFGYKMNFENKALLGKYIKMVVIFKSCAWWSDDELQWVSHSSFQLLKRFWKVAMLKALLSDSEDHNGLLLPTSTQLFNLQALSLVPPLA